jgi:hypothetical protein
MRTIAILASAAALALPVAAVAAPEPVAEPQPVYAISTSEPVRITRDSFAIRMSANALQTQAGRARLLASLQESARRLCTDVHPRADASACERGVVTMAELRTPPEVGRAIRLAQTEQQGTVLASVH